MISDDRSEHGAARFWAADIAYGLGKPPVLTRMQVFSLHIEDGRTFPEPGHGREASDAESIRFDSGNGALVWSSEGDARDGFGPAVRRMTIAGAPIAKLTLPSVFRFDPAARGGPRSNLSIEGLTFTRHGHVLWLSLEAPLIRDGPIASRESGADVRFTAVDPRSGALLHQYAYHLEPIGPAPQDRLADNGVSEILAIDNSHFLVIERSGVQQNDKEFLFRPRLFCASTRAATPVGELASLHDAHVRPMPKRLVFDFTTVTAPRIDNVEGMTWGPDLANGHRSLLFVTDNDFSTKRPPTQLIAFDASAHSAQAFARAFCPR
ncbi:MAG: esterase-like activity of phytase family protein [Sphingomonadaceae bacterium]|nr:esterase-like activity of phytase family protein [Sphingomonadaceae bacterium]